MMQVEDFDLREYHMRKQDEATSFIWSKRQAARCSECGPPSQCRLSQAKKSPGPASGFQMHRATRLSILLSSLGDHEGPIWRPSCRLYKCDGTRWSRPSSTNTCVFRAVSECTLHWLRIAYRHWALMPSSTVLRPMAILQLSSQGCSYELDDLNNISMTMAAWNT
jgi:hypothetical protein